MAYQKQACCLSRNPTFEVAQVSPATPRKTQNLDVVQLSSPFIQRSQHYPYRPFSYQGEFSSMFQPHALIF